MLRQMDEATKILLAAMERAAADVATEFNTVFVPLPNEAFKARVIGREGRNIQAFQQAAEVDVIVEDGMAGLVISSFDPRRREIAQRAMTRLIEDGRIQPGRIEAEVRRATEETDALARREAEAAVEDAGGLGLPEPVLEALARLRFRTSYQQNVLAHSGEVSRLAGLIAAELGLDERVARLAGLLHDVGKALGPDWPGPHALAGREFLLRHGVEEAVADAAGAHHREMEPATPEAMAVLIADRLSGARPGARRESLERVAARVQALEAIAMEMAGVTRAYALQAGREMHVIVDPGLIDDAGSERLAEQLARRIDQDPTLPKPIEITVLRQVRAQRRTGG